MAKVDKDVDAVAAAVAADEIKFKLPVDIEHKSTVLRIFSVAHPHMTAFHLSWVGFMLAFISTFAPAALLPVIREDINLTKTDLGNASIAAVVGAIASRIVMGNVVDTLGVRYGYSFLMLLTAPAVFCIGLVEESTGFIICRMFIGFSLASFVCCQFWCTSMFNTKIVGTANAVAAGWGNMGGGITQFLMPAVLDGLTLLVPQFIAWRWAFFVPGGLQVICGAVILMVGQDMPDGNYMELKRKQVMKKDVGWPVFRAALVNYRMWLMTLNYGYCFGVELTVDNIITSYLYDQFALNLQLAGLMGAIFGMMNLFSRASGGLISDWAAKMYGMRGRLWAHWTIQSLGGVFCLVLGLSSNSLTQTMVVLIIFSLFCQQACGTSFGIVPFISKRSTGLVYGFVGGGGNAGGAVTQAIFFTYSTLTVPQGFIWMGVMIMGITLLCTTPLYFPMWGGMFCKAKEGVTEEDYYLGEYTPEERAAGMASASLKFAVSSKSERGWGKSQREQPAQTDVNVTTTNVV